MGVCGQMFDGNRNIKVINETKNPTTKQGKKLNQKTTIGNDQIDLSPEQIQQIMEENANMSEEVKKLNTEVNNYKNQNANLLSENNQLKIACGQYQAMLLNLQNQNQTQNFLKNNNNNMNFWRDQINTLVNYNDNNYNNNCFANNMDINNDCNKNNINNNNFNNNNFNNNFNENNNNFNSNNFNNNNFNNNFNENNNFNNNGNNGKLKTIIFNFENGMRFSTVAFERCGLRDVFYLISIQIQDSEFSDVKKLQFIYNTHDVTKNFINNDKVRVLKLPMSSFIEVNRIRNALETKKLK